jgi:ATP-dependent DNA helicase RecG
LEITIAELQKLRESEDHIEFKEAKHNYPFAGGKHVDLKDRRRCVLLPWRMKRVDDWY